MALSRKVERRSDGKIFDSTNKAAAEYGRYGTQIAEAARKTELGVYATAYGAQWRYWKPGNQPAWPEKGVTSQRFKKLAASPRKLRRLVRTTINEMLVCPAGCEEECVCLEFCRQFVGSLLDKLDQEKLQNERQETDGAATPPA